VAGGLADPDFAGNYRQGILALLERSFQEVADFCDEAMAAGLYDWAARFFVGLPAGRASVDAGGRRAARDHALRFTRLRLSAVKAAGSPGIIHAGARPSGLPSSHASPECSMP
jgi:hypothetical protein